MSVKTIRRAAPPDPFEEYPFTILPLPEHEGGGYLITFPDLPGCMSDGATIGEALEHGRDAFHSWISATLDAGWNVPAPTRADPRSRGNYSGRFVQRVPKQIHAALAARAREEGVSLNSLVLALIAEGLGRRAAAGRSRIQEVAESSPRYGGRPKKRRG